MVWLVCGIIVFILMVVAIEVAIIPIVNSLKIMNQNLKIIAEQNDELLEQLRKNNSRKGTL